MQYTIQKKNIIMAEICTNFQPKKDIFIIMVLHDERCWTRTFYHFELLFFIYPIMFTPFIRSLFTFFSVFMGTSFIFPFFVLLMGKHCSSFLQLFLLSIPVPVFRKLKTHFFILI